MKIEQIAVGMFQVFCYIIGCEATGEGLIVDPSAEIPRILSRAKEMGVTNIKYIVLTHGHIDHTMGAAEAKKATGARIMMHQAERPSLRFLPNIIWRRFGGGKPPKPDIALKHNDIIEVGEEVRLKVLHTPGHSPGGVCLYTPGYVFSGDTLFVGGVGRTDLPGASMKVLRQSIREHLLTLPDDTVILPGHDYASEPSSTMAAEKRYNPFLRD